MSVINHQMSLYIPHVFANIGEDKIRKTFNLLDIGLVDHIDFVSKLGKDGKLYNSVYIHFSQWYNNVSTFNFQQRLKNLDKQTRVVYDDPWYWIVLENNSHKFISGERKQRINLDLTYQEEDTSAITDEEFDEMCEQIVLDDAAYEADMMETGRSWDYYDNAADEDVMMDVVQEESFDLVDACYVAQLEHSNKMLMDENMCLKSEITYIRSICNERDLYDGYAF
jgi:heat shock protein HspQ